MNILIHEPARDLPVSGSFDVVVVGGGIAGVAAAVAATRNSVSVCLLDKQSAVGGLATLGNVTMWLPICDGQGRQVIGGLGEELLKLSVADLRCDNTTARFTGIPSCWRPGGDVEERKNVRYRTGFNPAAYMFALEKLVVDSGVKLLYDTRFCAVRREARRISHLIVENKSGRFALACGTVVDATGDADVCFLAGEETESLNSNVPCGWFYTLKSGELELHKYSNPYCPSGAQEGGTGPFFRGDDGNQVTDHILQTRKSVRAKLAGLRAQHPEKDIQLLMPATIACFRMTRRLMGQYTLGEKHMHQWFDDAIGLTGDWRKPGPVYAIPKRSLCGVSTANLLAAGRCISADTSVWDVMRAIPPCVVSGEAAGTAAALAVKHADSDVHALDVRVLQRQLQSQGVLLDPALVRPPDKLEKTGKEKSPTSVRGDSVQGGDLSVQS
ncbi:MAG: FAD-dependent oxidoreductase [Verrucomicrobiota bacterium]